LILTVDPCNFNLRHPHYLKVFFTGNYIENLVQI